MNPFKPLHEWATLVLAALSTLTLHGMALIGNDESANLVRPLNGAPWAYVGAAQFRDTNGLLEGKATAVYLGQRFTLTAGHVGRPDRIGFPHGEFLVDTNVAPVVLPTGDLLLFQLVDDPGLPPLPLIRTHEPDLSQSSTLVGCGVGRGTGITGQGWLWGDLRIRRWGTNVTLDLLETGDGYGELLVTEFDRDGGADEAQPTHGDSGGALFQRHLGVWKLAGLSVAVDSAGAFFDKKPNEPGLQPDRGYHERIQFHRDEILRRTGLPDLASPLEAWRWAHFGSLAGTPSAADAADPDADGVVNYLEFAFGLNPTLPDADLLPKATLTGNLLAVEFVEPDAVGGVEYVAEVSGDLRGWTQLPDVGNGIQHRFELRTNEADAAFVRWKIAPLPGTTDFP